MSVIRTSEVTCPSCRSHQDFGIVYSVNADRRPDMRQAILDRTFQKTDCHSCGTSFRLEPHFTYFEQGGGHWIAVHPASALPDWRDHERDSQEIYATGYGDRAPLAVQDLCTGVRPRLVFGWPALREKLIAAAAGIDDGLLELVKLTLVRATGNLHLGEDIELRLKEATAETLVFDWIKSRSGEVLDRLEAPRAVCDTIDPASVDWRPLSDRLGEGLFVDMQRLMFEPA